jgi:hypothetical protein
MPKTRKWFVAECVDKVVELCPGSSDWQTHARRIGSVAAINRAEATKIAAETWPGMKLSITRGSQG